jgi:hypothetical protein
MVVLILGPTGNFPQGKINADDEGELGVAISAQNQHVVVEFGSRVSWIAMSPTEARTFAALIRSRANEIEPEET